MLSILYTLTSNRIISLSVTNIINMYSLILDFQKLYKKIGVLKA